MRGVLASMSVDLVSKPASLGDPLCQFGFHDGQFGFHDSQFGFHDGQFGFHEILYFIDF